MGVHVSFWIIIFDIYPVVEFLSHLIVLFFVFWMLSFKPGFSLSSFTFIKRLFLSSSLTFSSVQFSHSVTSDSLWPHELQHARPPCPSPTPRVHSNSHPSSQWCHPAISSSVIPISSCPQSLPASVFSNESALRMRWPKYWSFSFSIIPSKEHPGLISYYIQINTYSKPNEDYN